jgi:KDO2-lipid IV(A) lauroyltransferase
MHHRKRKFHPLLDTPLSLAARFAMTPALVAGLPACQRALDVVTPWYIRLDRKHYRRALRNVGDAYPGWSSEQVRECAEGCFRHMLHLSAEFLHTPRTLSRDSVTRHLTFTRIAPALRAVLSDRPVILLTGHIGNWELVGYALAMMGFEMAAVYRPLDLRGMDAFVKRSRESRGLHLISKFGAARAVPATLQAGLPIGLVADQSGGDRGIFTPFFGRLTSTYKLIALTAMRFEATIVCGMARRLAPREAPPDGPWMESLAGPAQLAMLERADGELRYSVETTDVFGPEDWNAQPDPLYYITARYRRAMEAMVRRGPEQHFWMHRIWRSRPAHERLGKPFPPALREKLSQLPWMEDADVGAIVERSARDASIGKELQSA